MFDQSLRFIKKNAPVVKAVLDYEKDLVSLSDDELKKKTQSLSDRYFQGETLDELLPEAFAVCREASWRVLGMKHFPVQVYGGIVLHNGDIAEMKTGEGKTLAVTLPAYLNALSGKSVHVVTVNEYLAKRDMEQMGRVFSFLGLKTGLLHNGQSPKDKKAAYLCDIVYGTNSEFGFDYLRDHMAIDLDNVVQRDLTYAIVDEVDSILIDEARTPLIITSPKEKPTDLYVTTKSFVESLCDEDIEYNEKERHVSLSETGVTKAEAAFCVEILSDTDNVALNHHINVALKAQFLLKRDVDYIVKNGDILLIDHFTGRIAFGKQYSDGIQQAVQAKEGLTICPENAVDATVTYQNYFRLYKKLSGMTGTAKTEADEFYQVYRLSVVEIPTNRPMVRIDQPDVIYKSVSDKYRALVKDIRQRHEMGQPVLVGTPNVEKSELVSGLLKQEGIPHQVLNAKQHEMEAHLVAQAGRMKAITIATNMAGRGTDILLGGNPKFMAEDQFIEKHGFGYSELETQDLCEEVKKLARLEYAEVKAAAEKVTASERELVLKAGGLYVVSTERHESRRIDNQLRGRSGRQGDPGESRFYLSLEDDLVRLFGGERVHAIADSLGLDNDTPISSGFLSNIVENAQKKIEGIHFGMRKTLIEYDDVINIQRNTIYKDRTTVLRASAEELVGYIGKMIDAEIQAAVSAFIAGSQDPELVDIANLNALLLPVFGFEVSANGADYTSKAFLEYLQASARKRFIGNFSVLNGNAARELLKRYILNEVDGLWKEHIDVVTELRKSVGLRGYGQKDPVTEYKFESYDLYKAMVRAISNNVVRNLFHTEISVESAS